MWLLICTTERRASPWVLYIIMALEWHGLESIHGVCTDVSVCVNLCGHMYMLSLWFCVRVWPCCAHQWSWCFHTAPGIESWKHFCWKRPSGSSSSRVNLTLSINHCQNQDMVYAYACAWRWVSESMKLPKCNFGSLEVLCNLYMHCPVCAFACSHTKYLKPPWDKAHLPCDLYTWTLTEIDIKK